MTYTPPSVVSNWHCVNPDCLELDIDKPAYSQLNSPHCGRCQQPMIEDPVAPQYPEPSAGTLTMTSGVPGTGTGISGTLIGNIVATTPTDSIATATWRVVGFDSTVPGEQVPYAPATCSISARLTAGANPVDAPMIMFGTTRAPTSNAVAAAFAQRYAWVRFTANQWELAVQDPTP